MVKADEGHTLTDEELAKLEKRIASVYGEAAEDLKKDIDEYFSQFVERDKKMKALVGTIHNGKEWTEDDYKQWRLNQIGRGQRMEALKEKLAQRITQANEVAVSYVNDATPGIYSLNRNYAAYTIESVSSAADFTLFCEQTVKRLIVEQPDLTPYYPKELAVKRGIDLEYGKKQITASVTSGILQGKSIKGIADDLQSRLTTMSRASAIRTARTAVTGAENAGRMDTYAAAQDMGIELVREWLATMDNRTRHAHGMLDGQRAEIGKPFKVDGYEIMFPGDRSAPAYLVYNCRCTLIAAVKDAEEFDEGRIAYSEWIEKKKAENPEGFDAYMKAGKNYQSDKRQYAEYINILGNKMPNTFASFQDMKYNDTEKWSMIKLDKNRRVELINNPGRALPGDRKTAATEKFTSYLFNQDNQKGWAKGQAFSSRLGYTAENYDSLRREIIAGAKRYPATNKGDNGYGVRYEQKMILYGKTGNPTNVVVGWLYKDGETRMTTAYISEV